MDSPESEPPGGDALDRRRFLHLAGTAGVGAALPGSEARARAPEANADWREEARSFALRGMGIAELQEALQAGRYTSRRLVELYAERIDALDRTGPELRHVLELNPDALAIAEKLDAERREEGPRGPLHGIPVLLKDNIDTGDRMATTAGSLALYGLRAGQDAFLVERLREAGALVLGKANLSEWANFRSTHSSSGWSAIGGQGRNPYVIDRSPCGSSSGPAGAVAASFAAAGIGTETDGSVVCPSGNCSLVGIKPTLGLISRSGIVPISHSQDTAGPMARTVADAAILLGAMTGADPEDPASTAKHAHEDYTAFLDPAGLDGARIGVARSHFGYSEEADGIAEEALEAMRQEGADLVDPAPIPNADAYGDSEFEVLLYEFKHDLNEYLRGRDGELPARSLEALIAFNEAHREREMPYFEQEIFEMAREKGPLTDQVYKDALAKNRRLSRSEGIDAVMDEHDLDALVAPTNHPAWPIDLINGDHHLGSASQPAAVSGYPHVTVPGGYSHGLPVGISFVGRAWSEPILIRIAYAFEQATEHRKEPTFRQTVG